MYWLEWCVPCFCFQFIFMLVCACLVFFFGFFIVSKTHVFLHCSFGCGNGSMYLLCSCHVCIIGNLPQLLRLMFGWMCLSFPIPMFSLMADLQSVALFFFMMFLCHTKPYTFVLFLVILATTPRHP